MNIFYLSHSPYLSALWQVDKHVVKMPLETAQLLSTAHHVAGSATPEMYKLTHRNHPSAVWVRECAENYAWTYSHLFHLLNVYSERYKRTHKTSQLLKVLSVLPSQIPRMTDKHIGTWVPPMKSVDVGTEVPQCMPDEFKDDKPSTAYKRYYAIGKKDLHAWKIKDHRPEWISKYG
jgi:hypothetical protein